MNICVYAHIHIYAYMYIHIHICICTYVYICIHMHIYIHICTYIYVYISYILCNLCIIYELKLYIIFTQCNPYIYTYFSTSHICRKYEIFAQKPVSKGSKFLNIRDLTPLNYKVFPL